MEEKNVNFTADDVFGITAEHYVPNKNLVPDDPGEEPRNFVEAVHDVLSDADIEDLLGARELIASMLKAKRSILQEQINILQAQMKQLSPTPVRTVPKRTRGRASKPKYANPANPNETWTGRGRRPEWYQEGMPTLEEIADSYANTDSEDDVPA